MENVEIVKIVVDDINSLFNVYDSDDISDELASYIEKRCSRTAKNQMKICIFTKSRLTTLEKDKVVTAIRSHYGLENKFLGIEIKKMQRVNICYFIAGILTIFIANMLPIGNFIKEIIDVLGCFIVYESSFNLLFTDNELDLQSYRAIKISKAHIEFDEIK